MGCIVVVVQGGLGYLREVVEMLIYSGFNRYLLMNKVILLICEVWVKVGFIWYICEIW